MVRRQLPQGFSLIELLIVVLLMGVLAALALPSLHANMYEELHSTAQVLCADLAYGRSLAVANNSSYRFRFDLAHNGYRLKHSGLNSALDVLPPAPFRSPSSSPNEHAVFLAELPQLSGRNVRLAAVTTASGSALKPAEVEFGPLGATMRSEETVVWLAAGDTETRYLSIHINPVTGLATVGEFTAQGPSGMTSSGTPLVPLP